LIGSAVASLSIFGYNIHAVNRRLGFQTRIKESFPARAAALTDLYIQVYTERFSVLEDQASDDVWEDIIEEEYLDLDFGMYIGLWEPK
jgi:hypothetical protein